MMSALLGASLAAFLISSVLYLLNLHAKGNRFATYGTAAGILGLILETVRLLRLTLSHVSPFSTAAESFFFLSWAIAALYMVGLAVFRLYSFGALAMPLSFASLSIAARLESMSNVGLFTNDGWVRLHVGVILMSTAAFSLSFCCAVFYLVQNRLLKSKKFRNVFRRLPPLETVDKLGYSLVSVGFPLLTFAIATAVVGVRRSNLMLAAASLTWLVYGVYLLSRRAPGWRGRRSNWLLIIGAFCLVITTALHQFI